MSVNNKKPEAKQKFVLISAGGTGGHMSPASALAVNLKERGFHVELITDHRGIRFEKMFPDVPSHIIRSGTAGAGLMGKLKGALNLVHGMIQARAKLKILKPDLVIGFGGYPSFPAVYMAQKLEIPTIIHEQNAILGKANQMLAPNAERIALSWSQSSGLEKEDQLRAVITGNPVRKQIMDLAETPYPDIVENGTIRVFIMGGSLGASIFSDVIPAAIEKLSQEHRSRLDIIQQCREQDFEETQKKYENLGKHATLRTFFDDVDQQLRQAHLFIGRSGASTVAELAVAARPAIYVPYPHHKDQQQKKNADVIADRDAGIVMEQKNFTADSLAAKFREILDKPEILQEMATNAKKHGEKDAARKLGNLVAAIIASES